MNKIIIMILILSITTSFYSYEVLNSQIGYIVDLPEEWEVLDSDNSSMVTFTDPTHNATFQIFCFKKDAFNNALEILNYIKKIFSAQGEHELFNYMDQESIFSDLTFNTFNHRVRGYAVLINGNNYDYALLSSAGMDYYEQLHDYLLSCINSFSSSKENKLYPGPVSQYYYSYPSKKNTSIKLNINNKYVNFNYDTNDIDATKVVIEREARILALTKDEYYNAWARYYRMIYKDNYNRLKDFSDSLREVINVSSINDLKDLISWIQGFTFYRTNTISDFTSPIELISTGKGDCDSRVIMLSIILNHLGIDSIILVSVKYRHSIIGIDINYEGKKILFNNKNYLLVELTKRLEIGILEDNISDLNYWFPMKLN
ncbi:MAG: hypothetical protein JXB50_10635 [Spirochaetes bacterium]|nr:hypothetical protein [Spirochaetota bacterium]